jgi:DSF synthase
VKEKELVIFIRQFATMIDAGLPLVQCLDILSAQGENPTFNAVLKDVKGHVEQGATFSDALSKHPKVFDELFCSLIRAGDRNGLLTYARQCVRGVHSFHVGLSAGAHTIALVQGDALGGGFEAALSCHTIVAEEDVGMGLPEVLFDLFPGMGAYSFLCKRVSATQAEKLMLEGNVISSNELYKMGLVDILVPRGEGAAAVEEVIRSNNRIPHARAAMHRVRGLAQPVTLDELMRITEIWVDTALQLGEKSMRTMERLVRAQHRRHGQQAEATAHG